VVGQGRQGLDRPLPRDGDADLDALLRQVPDARGVDLEVLSAVVHELAGVQGTDDLDRLREHRLPLLQRRPACADHVLVEALTAAET
jgi:hypothetical protein